MALGLFAPRLLRQGFRQSSDPPLSPSARAVSSSRARVCSSHLSVLKFCSC